MDNVEYSFESDQILKKWETDYSNLYACNSPLQNGQFLGEICQLERELSDTQYCHMLNREIDLQKPTIEFH